MTKKRTTKRKTSSRRKKKENPFLILNRLLKQTGKWTFIIFICLVVILFIVDFLGKDHSDWFRKKQGDSAGRDIEMPHTPSPVEPEKETKQEPAKENPKKVEKEPERKSEKKKPGVFVMPEGAEIPQLMEKRYEQVIEHEGYVVSYNSDYKIANWVAYELTDEEVKSKNVERSNKFVRDPMVKGATALNEDYTHTGFDRGHLAPAGDMRWSAKAMRESFYLSNICPQHPKLNRGIWKTLEEQVRVWALDYEAIYVATGPVIQDDMRVIGKNRVGVPEQFYKVVCVVADNRPVGIGFLFDNREYKKTTLKSMVIPIDSVEKVTGIDFFYRIPKDLQEKMESTVEWQYWGF